MYITVLLSPFETVSFVIVPDVIVTVLLFVKLVEAVIVPPERIISPLFSIVPVFNIPNPLSVSVPVFSTPPTVAL